MAEDLTETRDYLEGHGWQVEEDVDNPEKAMVKPPGKPWQDMKRTALAKVVGDRKALEATSQPEPQFTLSGTSPQQVPAQDPRPEMLRQGGADAAAAKPPMGGRLPRGSETPAADAAVRGPAFVLQPSSVTNQRTTQTTKGVDYEGAEEDLLAHRRAQAEAMLEKGRAEGSRYRDQAKELTKGLRELDRTQAEKQAYIDEREVERKGREDKLDRMNQAAADGKIDPNQYWAGQTGAGKASALVGVALGRFGASLRGSDTSGAMEVIKGAIARDIAAQESALANLGASAGREQGALRTFMDATGNLESAKSAAAASHYTMLENKLREIGLANKGTETEANSQVLAAELAAEATKEQMTAKEKMSDKVVTTKTSGGTSKYVARPLTPAEKDAYNENPPEFKHSLHRRGSKMLGTKGAQFHNDADARTYSQKNTDAMKLYALAGEVQELTKNMSDRFKISKNATVHSKLNSLKVLYQKVFLEGAMQVHEEMIIDKTIQGKELQDLFRLWKTSEGVNAMKHDIKRGMRFMEETYGYQPRSVPKRNQPIGGRGSYDEDKGDKKK